MRLFGCTIISTRSIQNKTLEETGVNENRTSTDKTTCSVLQRNGLTLLSLKVEEDDIVLAKQNEEIGA